MRGSQIRTTAALLVGNAILVALLCYVIINYNNLGDGGGGRGLPADMAAYNGKRKLIYFANSYFKYSFNFTELPPYCQTTHDPADFYRADAVVFHYLDAVQKPWLLSKHGRRIANVSSQQVWILMMYESAFYYKLQGSGFNWTMTYRRDSDVYSPYCGNFQLATEGNALTESHPELELLKSTRRYPVAWQVSNCVTPNERMGYAKELAKHIRVDIYGACSPSGMRCIGPPDVCWKHLAARYKFYLSFESNHCKDYITEKFKLALYYGMVPIVYGGFSNEDYETIAPPNSYIDTRDFKSPMELAAYLKKLEHNPELYEQYFAWRNKYILYQSSFLGQDVLCDKLWDLDRNRHIYSEKDLKNWWEGGACVDPPFHYEFPWLSDL